MRPNGQTVFFMLKSKNMNRSFCWICAVLAAAIVLSIFSTYSDASSVQAAQLGTPSGTAFQSFHAG